MKESLRPGLRGEHTFVVPPDKTVPHLYPEAPEFQEMPRVFATGFVVGLVEWTCLRVVNPHLDWPREQTLGTHVDLSHAAATPPGMTVTVQAELVEVDGRRLAFRVSAHDGKDVITEGRHERVVVDAARFRERVAAKAPPRDAGADAGGRPEAPRGELRVAPVTLEGLHVRLEPLSAAHVDGLLAAGEDPEIWRYLPIGGFARRADAEAFVAVAERGRSSGTELPFAIVRREDGRIVGSTRYLDVRPRDRALEIGWTWLSREVWRTPVNTECKLLLLRHAFEDLGAHRVQLKTDLRNLRSQRAIERIGGVREGVLRRHMTLHDGHVRDTVLFSLVDAEWPAAKARLEARLR